VSVALEGFARDVAEGLAREPKTIPPQYFYDDLGSLLFEAICRLPWYTITRAELALLTSAAPEIAAHLPRPLTLLELGPGGGQKLALVAEAAVAAGRVAVQLVDVSEEALTLATATLARLPVAVTCYRASFEEGLRAAAAQRDGTTLVLFLGSNIGNLDMAEAAAFVREIRRALRPGDGFLLGADLIKPERDLRLAYDDPLGVTAAFNKNVLIRMNRELGASFDPIDFRHHALWNPAESRMEMHLVAQRDVDVEVPLAGCRARLQEGESLFTECSYKYDPARLKALVEDAGFRLARRFVDGTAHFALLLFEAA